MEEKTGLPTAYDKELKAKPTHRGNTEISLQERKCAAGCGRTFKVHPKSPQTRARGNCERACGVKHKKDEKPVVVGEGQQSVSFHIFPEVKKKKHVWSPEFHRMSPQNKDKRKEGREPIVKLDDTTKLQNLERKEPAQKAKKALKEEKPKKEKPKMGSKKKAKPRQSKAKKQKRKPSPQKKKVANIKGYSRKKSPEEKWEELVNRARAKITTMHKARMEVAAMAMEACDIHWGGGDHWSNHNHVRTLKDFAREVGVHYKTLAQWVRVKRNIKDKLPKGVWRDDQYMLAVRADRKVKRDMDKEEVRNIYEQELLRDNDSHILVQGLKRVSSLRYFILAKAKFKKLRKEELRELRDYCLDIMERINDELGEEYVPRDERDEDMESFVG